MSVQSFMNRLCTIMLLLSVALQPIFAQKNQYSFTQQQKVNAANKLLIEGVAQKDSIKISDAYYALGRMDMETRNFLASTTCLFKGIKMRERYGNSDKLGRFYLRLSDNELAQKHHEKALFYSKKAAQIFKNVNSEQGLAIAYSQMGATFYEVYSIESATKSRLQIANYDSAIYYFHKTEQVFYQLKDTLGIADIYLRLGILAENKNDINAIQYYSKASNFYGLLNKKTDKLSSLLSLASGYLTFHQPKKAFSYISEAEDFRKKEQINDYVINKGFEKTYERYYQATGNWKKAFTHLEIFNNLEKRELMADNEGAVSRLNIEFETQIKESQLEKQKLALQLKDVNLIIQQRSLWIMSSLLFFTAVLSFVLFRLYKKNQRISQRNIELVKEQNHRVKNNLQVVSSLLSLQSNRLTDTVAKQAVEESMLRVETMAILHRKLYDGDDLAVINLTDFIVELVENVLKTFDFTHIEPQYLINKIKLSADQALPIGLIINELITNSCKYAFPENPNPSIAIACFSEKDKLVITVADNGLSFKNLLLEKSFTERPKTFGMRLIQMQIAQLYGSYYFESEGGIKFTMKFTPLNNFNRNS